MNLGRPQFWIAAFSMLAVISVAVVDLDKSSPGPLAVVHGRDAELSGKRSCSTCHGSWRQSMTSACLECHDAIGEHLESGDGLHGLLGQGDELRCGLCHSEHHGAGFEMVNAQSFAQAGVPDVEQFDHNIVGFDMLGGHLELDCNECHTHALDEVLEEGQQRYLGLVQDCVQCHAEQHEEVHEGRMRRSCTSCHNQEDFAVLEAFEHDRVLPLVGGHGAQDCSACHVADTLTDLERIGLNTSSRDARGCLDCHTSPHTEQFLGGSPNAAANVDPAASCGACHAPEHDSFASAGEQLTAAEHALTGFALAAPHDSVSCDDCHGSSEELFAERFPGREALDCAACHADPHAGQFAESEFVRRGCVDCHGDQQFEPLEFGLAEHAAAGFRLQGQHRETDCHACHEEQFAADVRRFTGTPQDCAACHVDAHDGFFRHTCQRMAELGLPAADPAAAADCASCHGAEAFADLDQQEFDHPLWTGFALDGAHAQESCESCHPRAQERDGAGRRFGRVAEHFGDFQGCVTCHDDPHGGVFDDERLPSVVNGGQDCARCHVTSTFRVLPDGFDHESWTGFDLLGAHAEASCSDCHAPLRRGASGERSSALAPGSSCADCHQDPHAGQFELAGENRCERCHDDTTDFRQLVFDHERDARFALGEQHSALECSQCHAEVSLEAAAGQPAVAPFVRYRPIKSECADCHGSQGDPLRRRRRRRF